MTFLSDLSTLNCVNKYGQAVKMDNAIKDHALDSLIESSNLKDLVQRIHKDKKLTSAFIDLLHEELIAPAPKIITRLLCYKILFPIINQGAEYADKQTKKLLYKVPLIGDALEKLTKFTDSNVQKIEQQLDQAKLTEETLRDITNNTQDLQKDLEELQFWLVKQQQDKTELLEAILTEVTKKPQPPLQFHYLPKADPLVFKSRNIPYQGRSEAFQFFHNFLESDENILWQVIYGPAGIGKSRFALEACLREVPAHWRCGFLSRSTFDSFTWATWEPTQSTLIIVDYAAEYAEKLHDIIADFHISYKGVHSVRWLLLERGIEHQIDHKVQYHWYEKFLGARSSKEAILESQYKEPYMLQDLSNDDLKTIMLHFFNNPLIIDDVFQKFCGIFSDHQRPLFAAIYASIYEDNPQVKSQEDIFEEYIKREKDIRWKNIPNELQRKDQKLLAWATICGGLDIKADYGALQTPQLFKFDNFDCDQQDKQRFEACGGSITNDIYMIPALEPDIIGEYFTLTTLTDHHGNLKDATLLNDAWQYAPLQTTYFLSRLIQDFRSHRATPAFLYCPESARNHRLIAFLWSMLSIQITGIYNNNNLIQNISKQLLTLAKHYFNDEKMMILQSQALFNLIIYYADQIDMKNVEEHYQILKNISKTYPKDQTIITQIKALVHLVAGYGKQHIH